MLTDADLLSAAEAAGFPLTRDRLVDWQALGLIEGHAPGRGPGPGRAPRTWSEEQGALLLDLLALRYKGWNVRKLADVAVSRWLHGDGSISLRQVRRALDTWSWPTRRRSLRVARQLARELLEGQPRSIRDYLSPYVVKALHTGRGLPPLTLDVGLRPHKEDERPPQLTHKEARVLLGRAQIIRELKLREGVVMIVRDKEPDDAAEFQAVGLKVVYADEEGLATDSDVREWREKTPGADRLLTVNSIEPPHLQSIVDVRWTVAGMASLAELPDECFGRARNRIVVLSPGEASGACRMLLTMLARLSDDGSRSERP